MDIVVSCKHGGITEIQTKGKKFYFNYPFGLRLKTENKRMDIEFDDCKNREAEIKLISPKKMEFQGVEAEILFSYSNSVKIDGEFIAVDEAFEVLYRLQD